MNLMVEIVASDGEVLSSAAGDGSEFAQIVAKAVDRARNSSPIEDILKGKKDRASCTIRLSRSDD
ncbi:MAG: hypothetical protein ACRED5_05315 [Propylenella sp.]